MRAGFPRAERIPAHWRVNAGNGQGRETESSSFDASFDFVVFDVQAIPYIDSEFDVVIANHMLYHVPDRGKAYSEIRRVLKPGGFLHAAANGKSDKRKLTELEQWVIPEPVCRQERS